MAAYISKDFVHKGCGLVLNPIQVWNSVPYSVHKNIKKAIKNKVTVRRAKGTNQDLDILKSMWYDADDPNMPTKINDKDYMFIAYLEDKPVGCIILLPVDKHLFLNNLAGNTIGKELRIQDYLLWYCVNELNGSQFKYIDVGVSYRKTLYDFFRKWKTFSYPVIFNKPAINIPIKFTPFDKSYLVNEPSEERVEEMLYFLNNLLQGHKITFVPNVEIAKTIISANGHTPIDATYNWTSIKNDNLYYIDLTQIFSVQFGALLVNSFIDDKTLWNLYRSQDIFKRELVFTAIYNEIFNMVGLIQKRIDNYLILEGFFSQDNISIIHKNEDILSGFYFSHNNNNKFSKKLTEFEIEHIYDSSTQIIGLPVHQNLTFPELELIYGIFRGVLNLCSEWIHTDYYSDLK